MNNFIFNGKEYRYLKHNYNNTRENERTIEVPIFMDILKSRQKSSILEVGNVLNHYGCKIKRDIVDLGERGKGVINQDIRSFSPAKKYDLIVSISTFEHIDENSCNPEQYTLDAFDNMKNLLAKDGNIWMTIPLSTNSHLDNLLKNKKLGTREEYFMLKDTINESMNIWMQVQDPVYERYKPPGLMLGFSKAGQVLISLLRTKCLAIIKI